MKVFERFSKLQLETVKRFGNALRFCPNIFERLYGVFDAIFKIEAKSQT